MSDLQVLCVFIHLSMLNEIFLYFKAWIVFFKKKKKGKPNSPKININ